MSEAAWTLVVGAILTLIGLGMAALAVPRHPDRAKAAKIFFSVAVVVFVWTLVYWTISTDRGLLARLAVDLLAASFIAGGSIAGFRFANRSSLAELSLPSSAFIPEPLLPQNKGLLALTIIGILAIIFVVNAMRNPGTAAKWIWAHIAIFWGAPWKWVLPATIVTAVPAAIVGFLIARRMHSAGSLSAQGAVRKSCADQWLHQKAEDDKASMKSLVRIPGIAYQPCFDPEGPYLDFVVSVFNGSLFDVVVNNAIGTSYIFNTTDSKKFHYPAKIESDEPIRLRSRCDNFFVIRQPLRFEEISAFQGKNKVLSFGSLVITFAGEEIGETRLDTNHVVETQKGGWRAWDQIGFICSYSDERWAALQSRNVAHFMELEELRGKLKEKDTVALAPPEIVAPQAPYFAWIGKETQVGKYIKVGTDFARYSNVQQAAFLDLYLKPIPGSVGLVDLSADIAFKGEKYDARVNAGVWYGRDSAKVPLRHNETQTLFIALYDGAFTTYEHQYKNRPLANPITPKTVYGHIHVFGEYENTQTLNLNWFVKLSRADESLTVENVDEDAFKAATQGLVMRPDHQL